MKAATDIVNIALTHSYASGCAEAFPLKGDGPDLYDLERL